jgi:hypothetical protein
VRTPHIWLKEIDEVKKIRRKIYIVMHMETAEKLPVAEASTAARMALIATSTTAITTYCQPRKAQ